MLFKQITGQKPTKNRLIQTVRESRVSHAQLFLGPEGSGKLAMAIAYAQYINCKDKQDDDACGNCPSCVKFNKLAHPDLHFVYPVATTSDVPKKPTSKDFITKWRELLLEENAYINLNDWYNKIGIENKQGIINAEDCNEIIKTLSYKSYESEYKVMIIWMVEKLFHSAAPKILKILEEPPDKTLFILVSENQHQIINTILSRTQIVKIPKIKDQDLRQTLVENLECAERDARRIAGFSDGNMIKALKLSNQDDDEKENFERFVQWMRLCYSYNLADLNKFVGEIAKIGREKQKSFLNSSLRVLRNSILKSYRMEDIVQTDESEAEFMKKFHQFINRRNDTQLVKEMEQAIYHIERNANPSILFMDLSLKISGLIKS